MIAAFQASIPDVWVGEDGNLMIVLRIEAGQIEGLYLANQLLLENLFIASANLNALERHGDQFGMARKTGTTSQGQVLLIGQGGIFIPTGTEVAYDPGSDQDILYFITTQSGTLPNAGTPTAPVASDGGIGTLLAGTYEWVVTFVTAVGETVPSIASNALILAVNHQGHLTIPLGGTGTVGRKVYRSVDGGDFLLVATIGENASTTYNDNTVNPGSQTPPDDDTSASIVLNAESEEVGTDYNVVPGAITIPASVPDGITDVTNLVAFTGGSDEEDIDTYRNRILTALRNPSSGSPGDLQAWAEAVEGVDSATVFSNDNLGTPTPGHATVRVSGPGGTIPPQSVLDAVVDALLAQDMANITIHVGTFTPLSINVTVDVTLDQNYATTDVTPNVVQAVSDYISSIPVAGIFYITGIIQHVREVSGVVDVAVSLPTSNQTAPAASKFTPGTIIVT